MSDLPVPLRAVLFVAIVIHLQLGSFADQVLHEGEPAFSKSWEMYASKAAALCVVEWFTVGPDGPVPIDRLAALELAPFWSAPTKDRLQHSESEVRAAGQRLCKKLGKGADVRARARCGLQRAGGVWKERITPDEPLCGVRRASPQPGTPE